MLRIGLDARYAYDHFPGIGRYVVNLAHALGSMELDHRIVLLYNPALPHTRYDVAALARLPGIELVTTRVPTFSPGEQLRLPRLARSLRLDMLHSPYYIKPYVGLPCPSLVTIHDLLGLRFPATLSPRGRLLYRLLMGLAVRTSARIITVSRSARDDIAHFYRISPERIPVTPEAADPHFVPQPAEQVAQVRAAYNLPARYVLYLGSNKPHKNLERLVHAWEQLMHTTSGTPMPPHLVIAGHYDPNYPQAQTLAQQLGLADSISFVPDVAEEDTPALYSGAEVFVFPSYFEGFGLPPLEAMACGVPVLCAHASSLPEVVGNAALTFDPYDVGELADGLRRLLASPALREQLRQQGLARAAAFSWQRTARATLAVYEAVQQEREARR